MLLGLQLLNLLEGVGASFEAVGYVGGTAVDDTGALAANELTFNVSYA